MEKDSLIIEQKPEPNSCKGLFFRGQKCLYWNRDKLVQRIELRLLRRRSCSGCKNCGPIKDVIIEFATFYYLNLTGVEDGKLYVPVFTNQSIDRETGIVDSYDIEFSEVPEK